MFKNIFSLVQAWFISQGKCSGCGNPLSKIAQKEKKMEEADVKCDKCGRQFRYNFSTKSYRRVLPDK